jgi:PAS domain S-box-containing protein
VTYVIGALLIVVAVQAAAIVALLIRKARRGHAERALRESEERVRLVVDRAPVMIYTARPDTTLDYLNSTCVKFLGLPIEKLRDNGWMDTAHPEDLDPALRIYYSAVEARKPFVAEYRVRNADGAYRWVLDSGVPRYGPDGSFAGYIGCVIDITERRKAEDQILESRTALEVSHQDIQQLAGQMLTAHEDERRRLARELHDDLTQRLARLAIDAGRLVQGDSGNRNVLAAMRDDLVRLSEDVHALSYRLHPSVLDDLGLVEALKAECDRVARHGALRVDVDASGVPEALPAEASLCLFRVAQEALRNATRHAQASAVTVLLSPSGKGLQLAVSDNGRGFEPGRARRRASLGLASMRERVRLLDGELDIESTPGRGTTVVARVPV